MKSTIRFDGSGSYKCKQLNLVTTDDSSLVESINGDNVLTIRKYAKANLLVDYADIDFTLKIKSISMKSAYASTTSSTYSVIVFVLFGYTHSESGLPVAINVDDVGKDLEIIKSGSTVTVKFDNTVIDTLKDVKGPIRGVRIKPAEINVNPADITTMVDLHIGDIEYNS